MQLIITGKEQAKLIDIAKAEGVGSCKGFWQWIHDNIKLMFNTFPWDIIVEYGGKDNDC